MIIYIFLFAAFVAVFVGYNMYLRNKSSEQAMIVERTDFKAEFANAERYKSEYLVNYLPYLKKAMGNTQIDAYTYGNADYGFTNALKDGLKNKLKEVATLGTVGFNTVVTAKYLVLSGDDLHLFDTNTDGEINRHLVFNPDQMQNATLTEYPMQGQVKAQAEARSKKIKAYKLSLPTEKGKALDLIVYSCLIYTETQEIATDPQKTIQDIVIGNDFLKQLGDRYPKLKVSLSMIA